MASKNWSWSRGKPFSSWCHYIQRNISRGVCRRTWKWKKFPYRVLFILEEVCKEKITEKAEMWFQVLTVLLIILNNVFNSLACTNRGLHISYAYRESQSLYWWCWQNYYWTVMGFLYLRRGIWSYKSQLIKPSDVSGALKIHWPSGRVIHKMHLVQHINFFFHQSSN